MKTGIRLSESTDGKLKQLIEEQCFREPLDVCRFAIGLALAKKVNPPKINGTLNTKYNIGTLDPNNFIKQAIEVLMREQLIDICAYEMAERLIEWGINELFSQAQNGRINFVDLLDQSDS